jgi:hypothetical protein
MTNLYQPALLAFRPALVMAQVFRVARGWF